MKRYFNRLTILQKIFAGIVVFALPIIVLLFYVVSGFNHDIRFTRLELLGSRLMMSLEGLAELIPEHQLLVRLYIGGDKSWEEKIDLVAGDIDKHFLFLQKEKEEFETPLQITEKDLKDAGIEQSHFSHIYKNWQELRTKWKKGAAIESDAAHEKIIKTIHGLIKRVGDTSNMVVDPGLDTYYMVDVGLLTMPKIQGRLRSFILFAESVLRKESTSQEDRVKFSIFAAMLENDIEHLRQSLEAALRENKKLYGDNTTLHSRIPPLRAGYESSALHFLVMVQRCADDPKLKISAVEFLGPARTLADAGLKLREASMLELQVLLDKKIRGYANRRFIALFLSLGALLLASLIVFVISRGITKSLAKVIDIAEDIAGGNLQKAMDALQKTGNVELHLNGNAKQSPENKGNEIHRLFQAIATMVSNLHFLLLQVGKSGIQVAASSARIAASAGQLETTVAEQASSINQASATSKEISVTSQEFAKTMNRVARMASEAAELASASMSSLSNINATMKTLLESTTESSEKLGTVNEKMGNITEVITTITKVANQINLLSLNAAIEAEKAGKYGIGFSVVAREIRRLADQTAVSAIDIEAMIVETQEAMRDGVSAVETYTKQTRTSTEKIVEISVDLLKAIEHTQELVPQFESVNQGMQTQSYSAAQINETMGQLNEAAKQTRDSLVEFKGVTEKLNEAVNDLQNEVARFSINS